MSVEVYKYQDYEKNLSHSELVGRARAEARGMTGHRDWEVRATDWYVDVLDENGNSTQVAYVWLQRWPDLEQDARDYEELEAIGEAQ